MKIRVLGTEEELEIFKKLLLENNLISPDQINRKLYQCNKEKTHFRQYFDAELPIQMEEQSKEKTKIEKEEKLKPKTYTFRPQKSPGK